MKIVNENNQYPQMSDAKFARLIKTIKNSRYMGHENFKDRYGKQFKRFVRYITDPPKNGRGIWDRTHNIDIRDNNKIGIEDRNSNYRSYILSDSQMKDLMDALNEVPDKSSAWKD